MGYHGCVVGHGFPGVNIQKDWIQENMPGVIVRPVEELLDGLHLDLTATNGIEVPYDGWVAVSLKVGTIGEIEVPMLVYSGDMDNPLVGYNVIAHILNGTGGSEFSENDLHSAFPGKGKSTLTAMVKVVKENDSVLLASVRSPPRNQLLGSGQTISLNVEFMWERSRAY
ncbi:hypothetical protein BSL78_12936 [Apostichopus japonicus]|uniref:Uncharacterized protein n=1 Tax=Stichopus japonicus TaxID=307972 RepID=A0A2G8KQC4_STIJA|nr:hypothetical protein BSL78_12936 [Apostichopus japonicus]